MQGNTNFWFENDIISTRCYQGFFGLNKLIFKINIFLLAFIFSITGCDHLTSIDDFDTESWISDQNGCKGERLKQYKVLLGHQEDLLGLNNKQMIKLLGMPERNELYQRNQKFFIYYITPATICRSEYQGEKLFLLVRFNAVGLSQEIFVQDQPNFRQ